MAMVLAEAFCFITILQRYEMPDGKKIILWDFFIILFIAVWDSGGFWNWPFACKRYIQWTSGTRETDNWRRESGKLSPFGFDFCERWGWPFTVWSRDQNKWSLRVCYITWLRVYLIILSITIPSERKQYRHLYILFPLSDNASMS